MSGDTYEALDNSPSTTVLLSGGADSAVLIHFLQSQFSGPMIAMHIDYGQPARRQELVAAQQIAKNYHIPLQLVSINGLPTPGTGFVFGRNAMLLVLAAAAKGAEGGMLALGIHAGTAYGDCRPHFINTMQCVLDVYSDGRLRVLAPFLDWSKSQIIDYGRSAGVPLQVTRSCEADTIQPCGECLSCKDMEAINARTSTTVDISR